VFAVVGRVLVNRVVVVLVGRGRLQTQCSKLIFYFYLQSKLSWNFWGEVFRFREPYIIRDWVFWGVYWQKLWMVQCNTPDLSRGCQQATMCSPFR